MLIAFVIAGLALVVLYHVEVTSLTETRTAARYQEAVSLAKSHMAVALHGGPLLPGNRQGDDGNGFHWRVRITPIEQTAVTPLTAVGPRQPASIPVVLYAVTIQVTWGEAGTETRREVRLETQQIGEPTR